jgi:type IV pilus assembly protein PilC
MIIIGVFAGAGLIYKLYGNTEAGRTKLAQLQLKLPMFGNISLLTAASQVANSMTTMLDAGLPVTRCVSITARTITNYFLSLEVGKVTGKLEEGRSLGASLREIEVMPDILVDMTAVGEETGELTETLRTVALFYDEELDTAVANAVAKLEPAILVFLAAFAGYIVIAIYIAIFELYGAM